LINRDEVKNIQEKIQKFITTQIQKETFFKYCTLIFRKTPVNEKTLYDKLMTGLVLCLPDEVMERDVNDFRKTLQTKYISAIATSDSYFELQSNPDVEKTKYQYYDSEVKIDTLYHALPSYFPNFSDYGFVPTLKEVCYNNFRIRSQKKLEAHLDMKR
jgi:hypothetical protein